VWSRGRFEGGEGGREGGREGWEKGRRSIDENESNA